MVTTDLNLIDKIDTYIASLKTVLDKLDRQELTVFMQIIINAYHAEKQIFIMGNGGSASTASHFSCDLNKGVSHERNKRFKIICLNDNIPTMLAYSNDFGFDNIFLEQLKNFLNDDDVVIAISGSGNSKNILKAVEYANSKGAMTIGVTGYNGGILKNMAKHSINANVEDMQITEDIHMILTHLTMQIMSEVGE